MKPDFCESLRCPACSCDHALRLLVGVSDQREAREGVLSCTACGATFEMHRGVPELLHDPPAHVVTEAEGLEQFAERMRAAGWDRDFVRRLPLVEHGYWYVQARSLHQLFTTVPFQPGQSILDVGSNTCWAANQFAQHGLRAVALDIATTELQGLYTADYFIDDGSVFFERILGSMHAIPLSSSSLDYVFCCEVLHHNDEQSLLRAFSEIFRVLRPGGRLLMVNETLKTLRNRRGVDICGVEEFKGYEHAHWAWRYRWAAIRAGFYTDVTEPHYRPFFGDAEAATTPAAARGYRWAVRAVTSRLRRSAHARRAYLAWLNHVWGDVSMNMIATKPSRYVVRHDILPPATRVLLMLAAGTRMRWGRARGRGSPRLPRTPEQADAAAHGR